MVRHFVLALVALAMLTGAPPVSAQAKRDLIVWGLGFGPDSKGFEAVVREFERRHPDIRVRILSMGAGRMDPQKLMTSIVGNVPPDVIHQDRFTIGDWASRGAFQSLDDLIQRDRNEPLCPRPEQYYPATWEEASYDGRVYAIPTGADDRALYWNRKVFRENADKLRAAGLDPDRPPQTWDETLRYGEALTEFNPDGSIKVAGFLPNYGNVWLYMYAFQNNASFLSPDGRTCTLNTPAAVEALQFIVDGYRLVGGYENAKKFETGFQGGENDPFAVGKVALKIDGDWILGNLARYSPNLDFGVAPPPVPRDRLERIGRFKDEKDTFVTWVGGFAYCIPTGAKNVDDAWTYIKFATSTEARLIEARAQRDWERRRGREFIPRISANIEANQLLFAEFRPRMPRFAEALKVHIELMNVARIRPVTFVGQPLWDEHVRALERAALGTMPPEQALAIGQAAVQRELNTFFESEQYPIIDLRVPAFVALSLFLGFAVFLAVQYRRLRLGRLAREEARWAYLFVAPWVIGFLVFTLGPMLASFLFSFTQYNVLSEPRWVGGQNYATMAGIDRDNMLKALGNAGYLAGIGVPLGLVTGLAVALLLNAAVRGMRYYRTLFYMPAIVPGVASAVLWIWLLTPDPSKGLINSVWQSTIGVWFGTPAPGWLNAEAWAKPSLIMMGMWGAGSGMILWLAGLKGIPTSLYEASQIDGANPKQQFWKVTLPMLSPIVFFNMVMGFIGALQEFDRVYIMRPSGGSVGPNDALLVPVYHLFRNGFDYFKMGYASAIAWVIFAIILILTLIQLKLAPRWVHVEVEK